MRKRTIIVSLLLLFALMIGFLAYGILIPKTAALTIPFKWRRIPIGQDKNTVYSYLGSPETKDSTGSNNTWYQGAKGRMYQLRIYYTDTVVAGYSIRYLFGDHIFSHSYLIDSATKSE